MLNTNFFFICIDVYRIHEGTNLDKMFDALSKLTDKKIISNISIERYKDMCEYPDFEQK